MSVTIRTERIGKLFEDLLGRKVIVKATAAFPVSGGNPTLTGVYETSEGTVLAACVCEMALVLHGGAALCLVPMYEAQEHAKAKKWDPSLVENFKEILNVCGQLFCEPQSPRVRLQGVCLGPEAVPEGAARLIAKPGKRLDVQLSITGYEGGRMAIFT